MDSAFQLKNRSTKTKVIIVVLGVLSIVLVSLLVWLMYRVTHDQPQEVVYSSDTTKDNGSGLGTADANGLSGGGAEALQGIPQPATAANNQKSTGSGTSSAANQQNSTSSASQQPVRSQTLSNGLKIEEYNSGQGEQVTKVGNTIVVHYIGYLSDGSVFDTSLKGEKKPFAFKLGAGQVISGWDIGLQEMHIGAVRRLTIPASLAYGPNGMPPSIPPNATLIFDVQLMAIQ